MRIEKELVLIAMLICSGICSAADRGRVLRFPPDRSLGKIKVLDVDEEREIQISHYTDSVESRDWSDWMSADYFSEAQGIVVIPAGKKAALFLYMDAFKDLSPLVNLKPDDLHMLTHELKAWDTKIPLSEKAMQHISHLTGLKDLRLFQTYAATASIRHITKLQSLETLYPPQGLTNKGLLYITQLKSLKRLVLAYPDGNRVTNKGINQCLPKLNKLEELTLLGKNINDAGLESLAEMPRLAYLSLRNGNYTDGVLKHIRKCRSLRILDLGYLPITNAGLQHLSEHQSLESLVLLATEITDRGLECLESIPNLKKINLGKFRQGQITDAGMVHLGRIASLEYLHLPAQGITDKGLAHLAKLKNLKNLRVCSSTSSPLTDNALKHISKLRSLEVISIGGNGFTDAGMDDLAGLTNLTRLNLIADSITGRGLAKLKTLQSLKRLSLCCGNISISDLSGLNGLKNLYELQARNIKTGNSSLDVSGIPSLEELVLHPSYKSPGLIVDADLACLSNLKNFKKLVLLSGIDRNRMDISGEGLKHLAGLTQMETLRLGGPNLKDADFRYFTNMKKLSYLTVFGGSLTDNCLKHLQALPHLKTLNIYQENDITDKALARLDANMPNLKAIEIFRNEK